MLTHIQAQKLLAKGFAKEQPIGGTERGVTLWLRSSAAIAMRYRVHGKPAGMVLGRFPELSLAEARRVANEALPGIKAGNDPANEKKAATAETRSGKYDVETVFAAYVARKLTTLRSAREVERILRKDAIDRWTGRDIRTIGDDDINEVLDRIDGRGSPYAANRCLAHLRAFFNWAAKKRQGYLAIAPTTGFDMPHAEVSRDRVLDPIEIKRIWDAAGKLGHPYAGIVRMMLITGQRESEIAGLKRSDIVADNGGVSWLIPASNAKNGIAHAVPLSPLAIDVIDEAPVIGGVDLIFASVKTGREAIGWSPVKRRIDRFLADDGGALEPWRWHDLRRTVASQMQALGIPPHIVEAVLNHKSGTIKGILQVYQRYSYGPEKRQALDAWSAKLAEIVGGGPAVADNVVPVVVAAVSRRRRGLRPAATRLGHAGPM